MKSIPFYGFIFSSRVEAFIQSLDEAKQDGLDILVKASSQGGDVFAGWGLIAEFDAFPNRKEIFVHGTASSMMAFALLYADDASCIPQSKFIMHRASMFREDETTRAWLESTNKDFREAMEKSLNIPKFEQIAGVSLDRFFDVTQPAVDVQLDAKQAKAIGLIKNIVPLESKEAHAINESMIAACHGEGVEMLKVETPEAKKDQKIEKTDTNMNLEELKKNHPNLVQAVIDEQRPTIEESAIKSERERVNAFLAFHDIDPTAVVKGIKEGEELGRDKIAEFTVQGIKNGALANAGAEGEGAEGAGEEEGGEDTDAELTKFRAEARASAGLTA